MISPLTHAHSWIHQTHVFKKMYTFMQIAWVTENYNSLKRRVLEGPYPPLNTSNYLRVIRYLNLNTRTCDLPCRQIIHFSFFLNFQVHSAKYWTKILGILYSFECIPHGVSKIWSQNFTMLTFFEKMCDILDLSSAHACRVLSVK